MPVDYNRLKRFLFDIKQKKCNYLFADRGKVVPHVKTVTPQTDNPTGIHPNIKRLLRIPNYRKAFDNES